MFSNENRGWLVVGCLLFSVSFLGVPGCGGDEDPEQQSDAGGSNSNNGNNGSEDENNDSGESKLPGAPTYLDDFKNSNAKVCFDGCSSAADCPGGESGNFVCYDGICTRSDKKVECSSDRYCMMSGQAQNRGCETGDCTGKSLCVRVAEGSFCLPEPGTLGCSGDTESIQLELEDGSGKGEVCFKTDLEHDLACVEGLCTDLSFATENLQPCRTGGNCPFDGMVCVDGHCGCEEDADCEQIDGFDKCYDGFCGCSGNSACAPDEECKQP